MLLEAQATFTPERRRLLLFIQVFVVRDIPDASNYTFETFGSGQLLSFNFPAVSYAAGQRLTVSRATTFPVGAREPAFELAYGFPPDLPDSGTFETWISALRVRLLKDNVVIDSVSNIPVGGRELCQGLF